MSIEPGVIAAIVSVSGAVAVGFVTVFAGERFKAHRLGSSIAGALAGELESYLPAFPLLDRNLSGWATTITSGYRHALTFRSFPRPTDIVLDAIVKDLGLLGPALVERVVFTYSQIRAFRGALDIINEQHTAMTDEELLERVRLGHDRLREAASCGPAVVAALRARAVEPFIPLWKLPGW